MSSKPTVVKDEPADEASEFATETIDVRGQRFVIRELTSKDYDKCVELATDKEGGLDTVKLLRWMLIKAVVEPKGFNAESLGDLSFTTVRKLSTAVNDLHFPQAEADSGNE